MHRKNKAAPPLQAHHRLAEEDLGRSGLTLDDLSLLGGEVADEARTVALGHSVAAPSIVFPYWDPFAEEFTPLDVFHRVRLLGALPGFAGQASRPQRYSQPRGTLNSLYVPRCVEGAPFDWRGFLTASTDTLYITEGEKKAACACKAGLRCVALGGVTAWSARARGARELPLLERVEMKGRTIVVVFDTDADAGLKPEVLRAARDLLDHLLLRGATPLLAVLPSRPGRKMGLDDYLVERGVAAFRDEVMPGCAVEHADAKTLCEAAARYAYLQDVDRFAPRCADDELVYMSVDHLDRALGRREVSLPRLERVRAQGGGYVVRPLPKVVRLADALLAWGGGERYACAAYEPGQPRVVEANGRRALNLWTGWRCEYAGTDRLPTAAVRERVLAEWFWALDNVFGDDPVAREHVERWLFYPIQRPGAKLATFALVTSREEGIGKSFVGHMIAKHLYGLTRPGPRHGWQLAEGDLHSPFNGYLNAVSFIEGDDVAAHDRKSVYERIKSYVSSDTVQINLKNVPQFMVQNRANFWLTSNDEAPFYLSGGDRRAFVHVPRRAAKDPERYHRLQLDFDAGVAGPALLWWARERFDAGSFSPVDEAPMTAGKREVCAAAETGPREWATTLVADVRELTRPCATPRELHALLSIEVPNGDRVTMEMLGHAMRAAGAARWAAGALVAVRRDGVVRRERVWLLDPAGPASRADRDEMERLLVAEPTFGRRRIAPRGAGKVIHGKF